MQEYLLVEYKNPETFMNTMLTWLGKADIENMENGEPAALANIALQHNPPFDNIIILANSWKDKTADFQAGLSSMLAQNNRHDQSIQVKNVELVSPIDYESIHLVTKEWITSLSERSDNLCINITSGTPAMAVVSVLLGKGKDNTTFYQSTPANEVFEANIPLDFRKEYARSAAKNLATKSTKVPDSAEAFLGITANSSLMKKTVKSAKKLSKTDVPILVLGETGTGKESMAKAIHAASLRADKPLRTINCGAIPSTLIDSILFGHKKGSFTGAVLDKEGIFEQADGGTLFLDEVGELSQDAQVKLLRVLQEGEVTRVGDDKVKNVDVRIIGATHRDLTNMMVSGEFREDLFYRLAVGIINIPSLRERTEDIAQLVEEFTNVINKVGEKQLEYKSKIISDSAIKFIQNQAWPGNIRELWNTLNRLFITSDKTVLEIADIQEATISREFNNNEKHVSMSYGQQVNIEQVIENTKKSYVEAALKATGNNYTQAAKMLNLNNRQTLKNWMENLGVTPMV
jgi:transcriptional regulator with PAS, ATPase and Fis domain